MSGLPFPIFLLFVFFGFGFMVFVISIVFELLKRRQELGHSTRSGFDEEDTQSMQELHQLAVRMEKRIETLETLLLDMSHRDTTTRC